MENDRVNGSTNRGSLPTSDDSLYEDWRSECGYGDKSDGDYLDVIAKEEEYRRQQEDAMRQNGILPPEDKKPDTQTNTPASTGSDSYTVRRDDSLWKIAKNHLGPDASAQDIIDYVKYLANKNGISDPNRIYPGQTINY